MKLPAALSRDRSTANRFYYGWVIVGVMGATGALSMALGSLNFGLFIKPMGDEMGVGRADFGWAQSSRQFASAASAPVLGPMIDRLGVRVLLAIAALITGLALSALAFATDGWQIIVLFAVMGVVGMSGPGALVTSVPVTKWFVHKRAKALAITSLGVPFGGFLFIPLTQIFIDSFGWRTAWILLAIIGAGVIIPLSLLFVHRQPEDLGLLPDGGATSTSAGHATGYRDEHSWTRHEAMRSGTFWRLVFVFSAVMLAVNSVGVHRIASFMDRGLDPLLISYATALDAAAAGLSTFVVGMLAHRVAPRILGACGFALLAFASVLTVIADNHPIMFASMIIFGLGIGTMMLMQNYLWAEYFGRRHLGSIRGAVMPIMLVLGGLGAPLAGYVRDHVGTYDPAWLCATALMLAGGITLAFTPAPNHPGP